MLSNSAKTSANLATNSSADHATQLLGINMLNNCVAWSPEEFATRFCYDRNLLFRQSDICHSIPLKKAMNYKKLHATAKFSCNSPKLCTNLATTDRNLDKISSNFTATFAKIRRTFTAAFCLSRSCGTTIFSKKFRNYIVPLLGVGTGRSSRRSC